MFALVKNKIGLPYHEIVGLFHDEDTANDALQLLEKGGKETKFGRFYFRVKEYSQPPVYETAEDAYRELRLY